MAATAKFYDGNVVGPPPPPPAEVLLLNASRSGYGTDPDSWLRGGGYYNTINNNLDTYSKCSASARARSGRGPGWALLACLLAPSKQWQVSLVAAVCLAGC